jgi:hypothetical protein
MQQNLIHFSEYMYVSASYRLFFGSYSYQKASLYINYKNHINYERLEVLSLVIMDGVIF